MKDKLPALLMIISLMVMNFASVMHAHASTVTSDDMQIIQSVDGDSEDGSPSNVEVQCHQCCCHGGSHLSLGSKSQNAYEFDSRKFFISTNESYLSQLNSPPFQPPKS